MGTGAQRHRGGGGAHRRFGRGGAGVHQRAGRAAAACLGIGGRPVMDPHADAAPVLLRAGNNMLPVRHGSGLAVTANEVNQ